MKKNIPIRTCVVTKKPEPKDHLIRVTKTKDNVISIDLTGKAHGRGAYITKSLDVILKAKQKKLLDKALDTKVPIEIYEQLESLCHD